MNIEKRRNLSTKIESINKNYSKLNMLDKIQTTLSINSKNVCVVVKNTNNSIVIEYPIIDLFDNIKNVIKDEISSTEDKLKFLSD